jgi:tetratricopeptide (TPR) repeat protein
MINAKTDTAKVNALNNAGSFFFDTETPDSGMSYFNAALLLSKHLKYDMGEDDAYSNIAYAFHMQGNTREASNYVLKAIEIRKRRGDLKAVASGFRNIGNMYLESGKYPEALQNYLQFLRVSEELKSEAGIARAYGSMGVVYMKQHDYTKALDNFFKTVEIQKRLDKKEDLSKTYNFIGNAYADQKMYVEALKYHHESLKLKEEIGDEEGMGSSYHNIAIIQSDLHQNKEALSNFEKALKIYNEYDLTASIVRVYVSLGTLYANMEKFSEAENSCLKALKMDEGNDLEIQSILHKNLSEIYNMTGNFAKSLEHYKKHIASNDSLLNEENIKKTVQLEMNYEFEKKEAETKLEQEKKEVIAKAERKKQQFIIVAVSSILVLVLFFAVFVYRSFLQKKKANQAILKQKAIIEEKQKEILDSIHYAKRIQSSLMSTESYIDKSIKRLRS